MAKKGPLYVTVSAIDPRVLFTPDRYILGMGEGGGGAGRAEFDWLPAKVTGCWPHDRMAKGLIANKDVRRIAWIFFLILYCVTIV